MNAKKIMGAVLVALLAAALFVGAGAADDVDAGIVFSYTNLAAYGTIPTTPGYTFAPGDVFTAADGTSIPVVGTASEPYFAADDAALGKQYTGKGITFKLSAPTAVISALDAQGASIIGKTVSKNVADTALNTGKITAVSAIFPGAPVVYIDENGVVYKTLTAFSAGKWGVAASLTNQANLTTSAATLGQVYYFTVAKTDATITAAKDVVNIGNKFVINVFVPGSTEATIIFDKADVKLVPNQGGILDDTVEGEVKIKLGIDGTGSVAFEALDNGKTTFELKGKEAEVDVTIEKGVITATADADYFYIGKPIALSGTTTAGSELYFYIEGTNFEFMPLDGIDKIYTEALEVENGAWTVEIDSSKVVQGNPEKTLIAGTYTVIVSTNDGSNKPTDKTLKEYVMGSTYGAAAVTMTQPFLTDIKAAAVAVQGTDYEITGTALAAESVNLYIFGTNFFVATDDTTDDDDAFEFTLAIPETGMAPGTYFYLIQHPMNDGIFNVWNETNGDFFYQATNATGKLDADKETFIFNVWKRGTNYAAQALLEAISGQDIDDIFVQGTFEVEAQKLTINPIPAEVAKGTALTISGSTNSGEGVEVIVNVLAGKFGATVKGDENSATFLTAKAVTEEDGTFEAAIDTSKLEVGSYIVTVEIAGTMYDSAAVEIVDKAPVTPPADDKPDTPVTPPADDKPTEPETPGFGALAALAGLGAVAVLLLRRE